MSKFLEFMFLVIAPASCAVLLTVGVILHFMGRLALALQLIMPSRRFGKKS